MATNYATATIQEVYDLQTQDAYMSILKVHTPIGNNVPTRLQGFFAQFSKFRYVGAKVTLVPASTLPADPLQLSYEAGEATIDPRDMVNPILWKHWHGEAMTDHMLVETDSDPFGVGLPDVDGTSVGVRKAANSNNLYSACLCDPSFRKSSIQSGFSVFVKPYAYNLVSGFQSLAGPDGETLFHLTISGTNQYTSMVGPYEKGFTGVNDATVKNEWPANAMFTNKMTRLGWMDTVSKVSRESMDALVPAMLPNLPMLWVMLPPAYKTEFYFRLIITHYFEFKGFHSAIGIMNVPSLKALPNGSVKPAVPAASPAGAPAVSSLDVEGLDIVSVADGVS